MAKGETERVPPKTIAADLFALNAVRKFFDYKPANPAYTVEAMTGLETAMLTAERARDDAERALIAAINTLIDTQWGFHNAALAMKEQVIAQYGSNSTQVEQMGLKRKSEYKQPQRGKKHTPKESGGAS